MKKMSHWTLMKIVLTVLVISLAVAGCSDDDDCPTSPGDTSVPATISPFSIAAVVNGASVDEVTTAMADYLHNVDDSDVFPANWIIAGGNDVDTPFAASLHLPGGGRIVELCNHHYAEQAMSFGSHHGVALPCEVGIYEADGNVEVTILNPEAIFQVFFGDVPVQYAFGMTDLAATVRNEIELVIESSLSEFSATFPHEDIGPKWGMEEIMGFWGMEYSTVLSFPIPAEYADTEADKLVYQDMFCAQMLETVTHSGMETVGCQVEGLSQGDWRSARPYTLGLPGHVTVVELCSPYYATMAISTGDHHSPALPCETAVFVEGDEIAVHILNPMFIFPIFFSDAPEEMMEGMAGLATAVQDDIILMMSASIEAMTVN